MTSAPILMTADEINCLIHQYFLDSGFNHSAFSLRAEGRLEQSANFQKIIPRGELVELLSKAQLYREVEAHWTGDSLITNCKTRFSLLEDHVCSHDGKLTMCNTIPAPLIEKDLRTIPMHMLDPSVKRKAGTPLDELRSEKKARKDDDLRSSTAQSTPQPEPSALRTVTNDSRGSSTDVTQTDTVVLDRSHPRKVKPVKSFDGDRGPVSIHMLEGHKTEVFVCAWNPIQPSILASGSKDTVVQLWDVPLSPQSSVPPNSRRTVVHMRQNEQGDLTSLDWNHDGTLLAIGSYDSILRVCKPSGEIDFALSQHEGPIFATRFSPSGKWLLTASLDNTVGIWDVKNKSLHSRQKCHTDCCLDVDWLDDEIYTSCGADHLIFISKVGETTPLKKLVGHSNEINQVKVNKSRRLLASCSDDWTARIWKTSVVQETGFVCDTAIVLEGHRNQVSGIMWCPPGGPNDPEILATLSFDTTSRLWDATTGACLRVFTNHKRAIFTLAFCPDGRWMATGGGDGWVFVYDVKEREKVWSWRSESTRRGIFELDWQQVGDVSRIAVASESKQVGVIDVSAICKST
ncbi:WD40 repeat-like protein [Stereum hirsutum FP-91666 SS1]|uniref:WD40 repeat-like protein n=1 Tax=Stereum hirsutum (strain FP-91666) TaxID=721885 RepID=UPI000444A148|nr:WD40 repeat-like protein [Stereum hirsutum FP-91666 SS1]EIM83444.1 WD40 repeat-like protein [Stereum hirsutum FP-91666 SS1]